MISARTKELRERFRVVVTIDNKPIYDHTHGDGIVVKDKRMAIDMLLVRRDFRENNMVLRWVDTRQMVADCLTKLTADPSFLRFVFKQGKFIIGKEDRSLEWRARERVLKREAREKSGTQGKKKGCVKSHVPSLSACQEGSADPMNRNANESIRSSDSERGA